MRTFQRGEGVEARFWNVEVRGAGLGVRHGKVGSPGRAQVIECGSEQRARAELKRRVRLKLAEGYAETTAETTAPLQVALESALVANPEDLPAHMAYADWLSEQPQPCLQARGEFIAVQLALEDEKKSSTERKRLQAREQALLEKHRDAWLGGLAGFTRPRPGEPANEFRFARGWLDTLLLSALTVNLARAVTRAAQTRLLRQLIIVGCDQEYDYIPGSDVVFSGGFPALSALRGARHLGNVRLFQLGDLGQRHFETYPDAQVLVEVLPAMPRLCELNLNAREVALNGILGRETPKQLRSLRLERVRLYDDGVRELARSDILGRLEVLQLWNARIGDSGARALARNKDLKKLHLLDLSFNYLTRSGLNALKKTGVNLVAEYQMTPAGDTDEDEFEDEVSFLLDFEDDWE
jgi:uncharacterized protein (TIGR02996 family)